MKKYILLFLVVFSSISFADVFQYRLYENSLKQFTPFVLEIQMDGAFKPGSKIEKVQLLVKTVDRLAPLFVWENTILAESIKFLWNMEGNLEIFGLSENTFKSIVHSEVANPWGDTSINPNDDYSVYTDLRIELSETETLNDMEFVIANETVEESCLWGVLKK